MRNASYVLIVFSVILLAACTQQPATAPAPGANNGKVVQVTIENFKFSPADITVNTGDTVVWTNKDSVSHTVRSGDQTVQSKELLPGDTFQYTFNKKGSYNYICSIHPSMRGSVKVE